VRTERVGSATLYLADSLEVLPTLRFDALITDPVWPTVQPEMLHGWDDPFGLLARAFGACNPQRAVIVLGFDCDPRFLMAVPDRLPFIRSQ
jgi:hypothetical protein